MTSKRAFDIVFSGLGLLCASPLLVLVGAAIVLYDFGSPFYIAPRVGRYGRTFRMVKFRSMVVNADRSGVTSTSTSDSRITPVGRFVRKYKLDELMQFWNVLIGDMSLVGPRPNVPSGVAVYTAEERTLLDIEPGITDFASIVFADEGEILRDYDDPDAAYDRLIRPWKSRLGIFYVHNHTSWIDLQLIGLTVASTVSRATALRGVHCLLRRLGAPQDLVNVALRHEALAAMRPLA